MLFSQFLCRCIEFNLCLLYIWYKVQGFCTPEMNKGTRLLPHSLYHYSSFALYQPFITPFWNTIALCILSTSDVFVLIWFKKKKPKLFQHILNCVKWVAIEFIFHNLFSCNLKLYIQTVIWPLKWHSIVQNYNVMSDGFIPFFSLVLCWLNRQNFFYDIKYIFSQSEIVVQPELNYMKKETIYLIKYMIITIEHIFNLFD